jgi:hypothetical protein
VNGGIFLTRSALRTLENSLPRQAIGVVVTLPNKKKKDCIYKYKNIYKEKKKKSRCSGGLGRFDFCRGGGCREGLNRPQ